MQRAASETEKTIVVLSPAYLEAEYTQPEWAAAFAEVRAFSKLVISVIYRE
jgi:hypothetical protein